VIPAIRRALPALAIACLPIVAGCAPAAQQPTNAVVVATQKTETSKPVALPNADGSLKFAVLGDFGNGLKGEYELADRMFKFHSGFPFELVVMVGDNLYGSERPQDFKTKFEIPYKPLLDAGVKFMGALGNHDSREQRFYKLFNMDGKLYYSFKAPKEKVRFFMLDSTYPVPEQLAWLENELKGASEDWRIAVFHHPLYSSGGRHGSDIQLRRMLEPLFVKYNVSVCLTGHDHFYERIKPQNGIVNFVVGSGGQLAVGDIAPNSPLTAQGFDTDQAFMAVEITGDKMYFNAVSRAGDIVDSGINERRVSP
jgi:hypothetical protein